MKKFTLVLLVFSHFLLTANAQLMDGKKSFSRKDTLRGFLSNERVNYDVKHYLLDIKIDITQTVKTVNLRWPTFNIHICNRT